MKEAKASNKNAKGLCETTTTHTSRKTSTFTIVVKDTCNGDAKGRLKSKGAKQNEFPW